MLRHNLTRHLTLVLIIASGAPAVLLPSNLYAADETASARIERVFDGLRISGDALESGGGRQAGITAATSVCHELVSSKFNEAFLESITGEDQKDGLYIAKLRQIVGHRINQGSSRAEDSLCAALTGQEVGGMDIQSEVNNILRQDIAPMLFAAGKGLGEEHNIPFLSRLDIGIGSEGGNLVSSVSSVEPIWEDPLSRHHIFAQASYYTTTSELEAGGFKKANDTLNLGVAYRYLTEDKTTLYGANLFVDHAPKTNHNRLSLGVDARTSQLAFAANKYIPLSDWKKVNNYYEEKAAGGFDLNLRGQVPSLPSWTGSLTAYEWDDQDNGENLYGAVGTVEYSPVPALAVRVGVRDESQANASLEAGLHFSYRFDKPDDVQWRERKGLAPVSDYVYEKVERQNIIRTKQQQRAEAKASVLETIGANTASEATGSSPLRVGQTLLMPVTISVANTAGALARIRLADGSLLTAGQNTQVRIEPTLITLLGGVIQYTSNGTIETVAVPGGTINLHGTDIDISSSGGNSTVRVRDGEVDFIGSISGTATLAPGEAAQSVSGVIGNLAVGSAGYISHTDIVSSAIDRVAEPITGPRIATYPYEAPRLISDTMTVGGIIVFGQRFTSPVTVSGGIPRLILTIKGVQRNAIYSGGSGTNDLQFTYTNVLGDISATSLVVNGFDLNGASIMGNGKLAVTTIADQSLAVSGTGDNTPPSGQAASWVTNPVNIANQAAAAFDITAAEVGATYNYAITSSGGAGSVSGSGTVATTTVNLTGIDLSALPDGTLTVSITLEDSSGNVSSTDTGTTTKDTIAPTVVSVSAAANQIFEP
jgi:hypothetical protein